MKKVTVALDRNKNASESEVGYKKVRKYLIPNDWDLIKLGDMSTKVGSGKTPRGGEAVYQNSGIPFIRSQNVLNNRLELNGISYISDSIHNEMKSTKVIPNDVLLNITGASIGRCCIVPDSFNEGNLNQHVCIIRTKDTLDRNYLVNILLSPIGQNQIMNNQAGGNREGLNFEQIRKFDIPLPPLKEQQKIASILSTWDKAIELKEKLIEQKKELKKGLMQKLLTGEVRMPGFEDEWKKVRIKDFCRTYSGGTPNRSIREYYEEGAIPWIKSGELNARKVTKVEEYITELGLKKSSAKLVSPNTLLLALYGATAGVIAKCEITATINQAILAIVPNERCNNNFLFYYLEYAMSEIINTYTQGGQPNLNAEIVKNLLVELPSTEEQNIISLIFMVCDEEIELYTKELEQLKYQKQSLMQQLLTGKVRVKV
ncbi:restriction endonuclease subunit S [Heyndrickxia sporothermodurans]|uniref:restriction endonuclease subunit S n=1 Tax=Heyndrickxia sporothermodurans TaxID=46224 RepID=UPI002DBBCE1B|nr:restriction endonuclease subunit S [Heyndrickxia sporothermodurans]MEB6551157.1 restriction endonuclease subunit S [Heyndrickxia sporothermodurans]